MAMMRDHNKKAVLSSVVQEEMAGRVSKRIKGSVNRLTEAKLTEMDMVNRYLHETTDRFKILEMVDTSYMHIVSYEEYVPNKPGKWPNDTWPTKQLAVIPNAYGMAIFDVDFKLVATYKNGVYENIKVPQPIEDPTLLYKGIISCLQSIKRLDSNERDDLGMEDFLDESIDNMIDMVDVWSYEDVRINPPEARDEIEEAIPESCKSSKLSEQWGKICDDLAGAHKQPKIEECEEDEDE